MPPTLNLTLWQGDHTNQSITRKINDNTFQMIRCNDIQLDRFTCMIDSDLQQVADYVVRAEQCFKDHPDTKSIQPSSIDAEDPRLFRPPANDPQ